MVQSVHKTQKQTHQLSERRSNSVFEGFYLWDKRYKIPSKYTIYLFSRVDIIL